MPRQPVEMFVIEGDRSRSHQDQGGIGTVIGREGRYGRTVVTKETIYTGESEGSVCGERLPQRDDEGYRGGL